MLDRRTPGQWGNNQNPNAPTLQRPINMMTFITDEYIIDPLGIAYLSAMLQQAGHKPQLVLTSQLKNLNGYFATPIIAFSVTTGKHQYYAELSRELKANSHRPILSIFGGPHGTFFPEFAGEKGVDFLFRGEGFDAIVEFANRWRKGKFHLLKTPNMVYRDGEILIANDLLPPKKISELPFPDRKIIYQFKKNRENPIKNVIASFGCPGQCSYCYNKQWTEMGYPLRVRSVESVIEECEQLVKDYPTTQLIYFQDDIFPVYRQDWIEAFSSKYAERVGIPFHLQFRIEMLKEPIIKALKAAGLHSCTFAIETADIKARYELLNRRVSNEDIFRGVTLLHKHNIPFRSENILGIPGETIKSALVTLDLNIQCKTDVGWASLYTPYPGTDLEEYCQKENLIDMTGWNGDFFSHATLKTKDKKKIEKLQKLFGLICAIPKLRFLLPILIRLPFTYQKTYRRVKQWLYQNKLFKTG